MKKKHLRMVIKDLETKFDIARDIITLNYKTIKGLIVDIEERKASEVILHSTIDKLHSILDEKDEEISFNEEAVDNAVNLMRENRITIEDQGEEIESTKEKLDKITVLAIYYAKIIGNLFDENNNLRKTARNQEKRLMDITNNV